MAKKLAVLGGGESGVGAALLAQAKGFDVFLSDRGTLGDAYREELIRHGIAFEEGGHSEERILSADEVVKSPGIPDKVPLIGKLHEKGVPVIGEIEFAARYTKARLIAITGSNGKTTTTLLTYHLLKEAGFNVGLAGNIGDSFAKQVIDDPYDYYVLEISSFMLDTMFEFKADIAILSNITPDHLDRYHYDFQEYIDSKFRILQNMTKEDTFIYWQESEAIAGELVRRGGAETLVPRRWPVSTQELQAPGVATPGVATPGATAPGATIAGGAIRIRTAAADFSVALSDLPIAGTHNALNAGFAILAALAAGVSEEQIRTHLKTFRNAPHRLEPVGEYNGVRFVNDSKATNVDSVFFALGSYTNPLILIMGGVDKGNDYTQIEALVEKQVKVLICLGTENEKLKRFFGGKVPVILETQDVRQAVAWGLEYGQSGDIVLLSPACASFDLFKNYEDRGDQFREAVRHAIHLQS